jgi:phage terminase large subunit-like protein
MTWLIVSARKIVAPSKSRGEPDSQLQSQVVVYRDLNILLRPQIAFGSQARAEPVAALYEQGRMHHVSSFVGLEDEMVT